MVGEQEFGPRELQVQTKSREHSFYYTQQQEKNNWGPVLNIAGSVGSGYKDHAW